MAGAYAIGEEEFSRNGKKIIELGKKENVTQEEFVNFLSRHDNVNISRNSGFPSARALEMKNKLKKKIANKTTRNQLGFVAGPFKKLTRNQRRRLRKKKLKQGARPPTKPSLGFIAGPFKK